MPAPARSAPSAHAETEGRVLEIERVFDAPRALVFKAWTEPKHLLHWMGPRNYPAIHFEQDLRIGGRWRGCLKGIEKGDELWQGGELLEFEENKRLVYSFMWENDHPATDHETTVDVTFEDAPGGKTKIIFRQWIFPSREERDGHNGGWSSAFDRFEDYLADLKTKG